jgi:hypothetical protein
MSFTGLHKLFSYCLIASGYLAIAATGAPGAFATLLFGAALAAAWLVDVRRLRPFLSSRAAGYVMLAAVPFVLLDSALRSRPIPTAVLQLSLLFVATKLLAPKGDRDFALLYVMSGCAVFAAAFLTDGPVFLPCLFLYLASAVGALVLFEMKRSSAAGPAGGNVSRLWFRRPCGGRGWSCFPDSRPAGSYRGR